MKSLKGIHKNAFIISSFDKSLILSLIPAENSSITITESTPSKLKYNTFPTSKSQHIAGIEKIIKELKSLSYGKCVLSRIICGDLHHPIFETLQTIVSQYPSAFIFAYSTPETGLWLGASPEMLLMSKDGRLSTMSLAGTRKQGLNLPWDNKNMEEQQIVTQFIMDTLASHGLIPQCFKLFTKSAGPAEHLCQIITAENHIENTTKLESLLNELSPTPALSGYPVKTALSFIKEIEAHDRECYGGFCGPFSNIETFNFFVNLRSTKIFNKQKRYIQFVGGGITRFSNPEDEWEETILKSKTLDL
ncbi:MAG: chorismate-binding protein [Prevotella sp.]|nr:chorismate-binding protein [Bacteroides sp.]MCM1366886.1 chorismate-binding protein [Prevotella sp.]MCM1437160.1 chorismate-binding protein [Prevotella sp.]